MSRSRRKDTPAPAQPEYGGRCLICLQPARDSSAVDVPEILQYNGRKLSADELEHHARHRLSMREGCITFWRSGISICWAARLVGAAGDDATERALHAMKRLGR